ncbi:nuclear transport factor 2 family protein [Botryobacter ruber]|uniref:nuclear transport factor 2 family protein n=1 Tax=Botryobacter ruber TaxID=2171629 RepID=UPI000E09EBF5|nr:nuclear transport factor 2 family protein [Botryobacter ruber]
MLKKLFCLLLVCLAFSVVTEAQSKEEKDVAAAVEALRKAMVDADKKKLEALTASDLSYGHSSGKLEDKATFVETIVSGKSDFVSIDLKDQTVKVSGNTALVRHQLSGETNDGGTPGTVKLGVLLVWQKQQGQWKLLARQAYKL